MHPTGFARRVAALLRLTLPALALTVPCAAAAQTPAPPPLEGGVALVIGNATYPGLAPLPACVASAQAVAAALRGFNLALVEHENASAQEMASALATFAAEIRKRVTPATVIYVCGYGADIDGQSVLLPVPSAAPRAADMLTQGVRSSAILATVGQAKAGASLAVLDIVKLPNAASDAALAALARSDLPPQLGLLAATETPTGNGPTRLADALAEAVQAYPPATAPGLLESVRAVMARQSAVRVVAVHGLPGAADAAVNPPAPPPAPKAPEHPASAAPPPLPIAPAAAPAPALPDQGHMTQADRQRVQAALARLGYYDGKVDGRFGPDSRAAIRRWQFELHAPMTGKLTAAEANRLARY